MFSPAAALARCAAALLLAAASLTAFAQASAPLPRPSLESFFNNPQFAHAALSPSGKLLAVIEGGKGKRDGLTVIDLSSRQVYTAARFVDVDIRQFEWVNDSASYSTPSTSSSVPAIYAFIRACSRPTTMAANSSS